MSGIYYLVNWWHNTAIGADVYSDQHLIVGLFRIKVAISYKLESITHRL